MELFFASRDEITDDEIHLDSFESKHILQVLRKTPGEKLTITDGNGNLFYTRLSNQNSPLTLSITRTEKILRPKADIALAFGFIRPSRLDFILEKGTELGARQFYIFRSEHSNYISKNKKRYEKIIRQAMKQSRQFYLPEINISASFESFISETSKFDYKFAAIDSNAPSIMPELENMPLSESPSVLLVIGPEGGFSNDETAIFKNNNFHAFSLGPNRLRSETAAIASLSMVKLYLEHKKEVHLGVR